MRTQLPQTLTEIFEHHAKEQYRSWIQPKSGDLLGDARYFLARAKATDKKAKRALYGQACLLLSAAAIEATTNDALARVMASVGARPGQKM